MRVVDKTLGLLAQFGRRRQHHRIFLIVPDQKSHGQFLFLLSDKSDHATSLWLSSMFIGFIVLVVFIELRSVRRIWLFNKTEATNTSLIDQPDEPKELNKRNERYNAENPLHILNTASARIDLGDCPEDLRCPSARPSTFSASSSSAAWNVTAFCISLYTG